MTVQLDHTIVAAPDNTVSATFLSEIMGLAEPKQMGHFVAVETDNGVTFDFASTDERIRSQHYAFLVGDDDFDEIFGRIRERDLPYWADPGQNQPGEIRHRGESRGIYFEDPGGHLLEILTRPEGA